MFDNDVFDNSMLESLTTHELSLRKFNLETALCEEEFHYNSIAERKSWAGSEIAIRLLFLIPFSLVYVLVVILLIVSLIVLATNPNTDNPFIKLTSLSLVTIPLFFTLATPVLIRLWKEQVEQTSLFTGNTPKSSNFGSRNFGEEKRQSEKSIILMRDELKKLNEVLKYRYQEEKIIKPELNDDLWAYGLGQYNEDKITIQLRRKNGFYDQEKTELENDIKEYYTRIRFLSQQRYEIAESYNKAKERFFNGICIIVLLIGLITIASGIFEAKATTICFVGMLIAIFLLWYFYQSFKMPHLIYNIEFNTAKYLDAQDRTGYKPTEYEHKLIKSDLADKQKRLEYVERILREL